jgi:hypothetical protein
MDTLLGIVYGMDLQQKGIYHARNRIRIGRKI